jgi:hypothetical protein
MVLQGRFWTQGLVSYKSIHLRVNDTVSSLSFCLTSLTILTSLTVTQKILHDAFLYAVGIDKRLKVPVPMLLSPADTSSSDHAWAEEVQPKVWVPRLESLPYFVDRSKGFHRVRYLKPGTTEIMTFHIYYVPQIPAFCHRLNGNVAIERQAFGERRASTKTARWYGSVLAVRVQENGAANSSHVIDVEDCDGPHCNEAVRQ